MSFHRNLSDKIFLIIIQKTTCEYKKETAENQRLKTKNKQFSHYKQQREIFWNAQKL